MRVATLSDWHDAAAHIDCPPACELLRVRGAMLTPEGADAEARARRLYLVADSARARSRINLVRGILIGLFVGLMFGWVAR